MAIEKTVFTGRTQAANAPEVYAFLNANKEGYFDSVEMDGATDNITCYVGETPVLTLGFDGTSKNIKITLTSCQNFKGTCACDGLQHRVDHRIKYGYDCDTVLRSGKQLNIELVL